jgi:hypothetical protein
MLRTETVRAALAALVALISLVPQEELPVGVWFVLVYTSSSHSMPRGGSSARHRW